MIEDLTNSSFDCLLPLVKPSEHKSTVIKNVPMPVTRDRPIHAAMILWAIALVALIGLNAIAPDYLRARKNDSSGGTGISQPLDIQPATGHTVNPLVFQSSNQDCLTVILVSRLLAIEHFAENPPSEFSHGAVRGRAPPEVLFT
jgi:hypothetical protein